MGELKAPWSKAIEPYREIGEQTTDALESREALKDDLWAMRTELEQDRDKIPNYSFWRDDPRADGFKMVAGMAAGSVAIGAVANLAMASSSLSTLTKLTQGAGFGAGIGALVSVWLLAQSGSGQLDDDVLMRNDDYARISGQLDAPWEQIQRHGGLERAEEVSEAWGEVHPDPGFEYMANRASNRFERIAAADKDASGWIDVDPYGREAGSLGDEVTWLREVDTNGDRRATAEEVRSAIISEVIAERLSEADLQPAE